ncbi:MAG: hypothetical protein MSG64_05045 [Pyrinomonadaceae bacterium MAG19_C2-C3]|nr:hypothetical protein [Pyrinomonadaceae bacterium MAG19_C2-C3]
MSAQLIARKLFSLHHITFLSSLKSLFIFSFLVIVFITANLVAKATTLNVPVGGDLQAVINAARPGDTIVLPAGATFTGSFTLPDKGAGENWITFLSSDAALLSEGVRVTPSDAARMPKLVTPGRGEPVLRTQAGAHHYRFVGLEFTPASRAAVAHDLILFGDGSSAQTTLAQMPHHLVLDRCFVHGTTAGTMKRGVSLNSSQTTIVNSYFADFKAHGQDTQAIAGWNGSGNYLIENNYLEASGYPVMFGGSDVHVPDLVPSDIRILRNTFTRPLQWRAAGYTVKNLFELKSARRVTIDGNLFENNWQHSQSGIAIVFTVRDEDGRVPHAVIEDVDFTNNIVRHTGAGISIYGAEGRGVRRIRFANNLFDDVGGEWGGNGNFLLITQADDITLDHNTIFHTGSFAYPYAEVPMSGFVMTNNLAAHNDYGIIGEGYGIGNIGISHYFPNATVRRNVLAGGSAGRYPADNFFPQTLDDVGFNDRANGDYRLSPSSRYRTAGTDGKDLGCEWDALERAMKGEGGEVIPVPVPLVTLQHVTAAHTNAAALVASTGGLSPAQFDSLIDEIVQANLTAQSEAGRLGDMANEVEVRLTVALYFTRAAHSLARVEALDSSVRSRLQIAAEHLNQVREALLPPNSNVVFNTVEASAKAVPSISLADMRSSATLASVVAPASAATIMLDRAVTSRGAARVPSSSRASVYELAGISITVGGRAATLVDVSQSRVGFVVPRESALGEAEVVVTTQSGTIARGTVTVASIAPGIFVKSVGGVGLPLGKAGFTRGGFFRTTTMDASVNVATKLTISATGFSFAAPNTNFANDGRSTSGMTPNLAESVAVEARVRDGRTWWLNVEFAGVSQAATGMDQVTVMLPPELRNVGTLELTLVIGEMRSNSASLNFRTPIVPSELTTVTIKGGRK